MTETRMSRRAVISSLALGLMLWLPGLVAPWVGMGMRVGEAVPVLSLSLALLLAPLVLVGRLRLYFLLWLPLVPLVPVYLFLCLEFHSVPGDALISAALTTDWRQSLQLVLSYGRILLIVPAYTLAYLWLWRQLPADSQVGWKRRKALLAGLLVYVMVGSLGRQDLAVWVSLPPLLEQRTMSRTFPLHLVQSLRRAQAHQRDLARDASVHGRSDPAASGPLLVVMVLGESVRADHLSLNGYPRNTTPWLAARGPDWLNFSDLLSTAQWTAVAVPQLMSRKRPDGRAPLIQTFAEAGFRTAWISNQERTLLSRAAEVVEHAVGDDEHLYRRDAELLPLFDAFVRQAGPRQFVVLHMHGSHFPYEGRYSHAQRRFGPTLADIGVTRPPRPEHKAETVNSYDNTLVAMDQFMERVHAILAGEERPVLLLYTSDHGENLFDDERLRFMHAQNEISRFELQVPLLIWGNEAYRRSRPEAWAALQAHRASKLSHLDIFPTVLDLARVRWDGQAAGDSFAASDFKPKPRVLMDLSDRQVGDADQVR